ncbi:MAG: 50S ribosomal protein L15 [Candidatus Hydrogenedentes bacterium]|nr:50S ribosomal protein L15 [Candidatus Hydrogenedentota bacterium]
MDLSNITVAAGARKNRKRKGRGVGSGNGKTAGRGHKGQGARSGYSKKAGHEGGQTPLARRLPKVGFWHESRFPMAIVNLDDIEKAFKAGDTVNAESLTKAKLIDPQKGGVKVLGRGEITKKFSVAAHAISEGARAKIEAAGGTVELIGPKTYGRPNKPVKRAREDN